MTKCLLRVLRGESLSPPPLWLMRQAGRYLPEYLETRSQSEDFLDFCYSPDLALKVTMQPLHRYDFDAAILFSDILVVPDALGQKVEFVKGKGPVLQPITTRTALETILSTDNFHVHLEPVYETVRRIAQEIPKTTTLIGFAGAPWTVATYMVEGQGSKDYAQVRFLAYENQDFFQRLIDMLVDITASYLIEQVNNGAEALQVFDSWAGVLSENQFIRWVIEPMFRIVERIKAIHPTVPVIGFPRGAGVLYKRYVQETGVDAVGLDHSVPLTWARDNIQPFAAIQGNLDNLLLVAGGEAMEMQVRKIIEIFGEGPFIFNLGHGIVPQTPLENVVRLCEIVREKV